MKKIKLPRTFFPTDEELKKMKKERYKEHQKTPENMSYWFPKLEALKNNSVLQLPKTKIIPLPFEWWEWLRTDHYSDEMIEKFQQFILEEVGSFEKGKKLFLKTGIFSSKFTFRFTKCNENREEIADKFSSIIYHSLLLGADSTAELVVREFLESKEDVPTIYEGMPLHTEFRVFYDFDNKKVIGVSNYWNPEVMTPENLYEDYSEYEKVKGKIMKEYDDNKEFVVEEVERFLRHCDSLQGRWSIDVMKNGDDYLLIDIARMERSALLDVMESVKEGKVQIG